MISSGKATLRELQTVYSVQDCFDMIEVTVIDNRNQATLRAAAAEAARR